MGKRQHYVPVFYLRGFLDGNEDYLWVYEEGKQARKTSPEATGFENYSYAFTGPDGELDVDTLDNALTQVEGSAFKSFEKIKALYPIDELDRLAFAAFVALMIARVPAFREYLHKFAIKMVRDNQVEIASDPKRFAEYMGKIQKATGVEIVGPIEELRKAVLSLEGPYNINVPKKDFTLHGIAMSVLVGRIILKMNWQFIQAGEVGKFLTSDNPVINNGPRIDDRRGSVHFPVSRELYFIGHWKEQKHPVVYREIEKVEHLKELNWLTIAGAKRYVFCSEASVEVQKWVDNDIETKVLEMEK